MKIKKGFTLRSVMGQNIVMAEDANADTFGKLITLNSSAAMLWDELKGKSFEVEDAAKLLVDRYVIDTAEALADATHIISRFKEKGLVE